MPLLTEPLGHASIVRVREPPALTDKPIKLPLQPTKSLVEPLLAQPGLFLLQFKSLAQHGSDGSREAHRPFRLLQLHLLEIFLDVPQALLLKPLQEKMMVIGQETVGMQYSLELFSKDTHHHLMGARGIDGIDGDTLAGKGPQPGREHPNSPARFIGKDRCALSKRQEHLIINRLGRLCQPYVRLAERTPSDRQVPGCAEELGYLGVRHSQPMLHVSGKSSNIGAKMDARSTCGRGRLLLMAGTHSLLAGRTVAAVADKAPCLRPHHRGVHLKVLVRTDLLEFAPTLRAATQRRLKGLLDFPGLWQRAVGESPLSLLAARLLWVARLRSFGKGSRLTLAVSTKAFYLGL